MFQGTGSNVGKSLLVAGLCRAYAARGLRVRPFKPQNMSNNAAVAGDGREIGRAQALQARAAGIEPCVHMNPVLLKPESEHGAQVVVQGTVTCTADARRYHALKAELMPRVLESFERLAEEADLILVEGAGSPAEVNLRENDIANMGFALAARVPVALVGDVDRGGVIASLVGTWALLPAPERALTKGFVINKFRGDATLFDGANEVIERETGWAALGLVPWFEAARLLPAEDSVSLDSTPAVPPSTTGRAIKIAVPRLPRISNTDDLDPLRAEPDTVLDLVPPGRALPGDADLVLIPGSKATRSDLEALHREGWALDIQAHVRRGGWLVGLCGGYQMLGHRVADPAGIEGPPGETPGLGLLDVETVMSEGKRLVRASGHAREGGEAVSGYEMHMGRTTGPDTARPLVTLASGPDGARSGNGRVMGCYLHGLFAADGFRRAFLGRLRGGRRPASPTTPWWSRPSTPSPPISRPISTSTACLRWPVRAEPRLRPAERRPGSDGGGEHRHQRAGRREDPDRAPHVIRRRVVSAVAEPGLVGRRLALVVAGAQQGEAERAGHRGFRPAGIGRAVPGGIAHHGAPRLARRGTGNGERRRRDQPARDARRHPVHRIVDTRRRAAEGTVAGGAVADHAVHRVDRLVGEQPRQAEQQIPEGRRDHAVGIVLGAALDRRAGDAVLIEGAHVAADDVAQLGPRGVCAGIEGPRHPHHVIGHGALREQHRHQQRARRASPNRERTLGRR